MLPKWLSYILQTVFSRQKQFCLPLQERFTTVLAINYNKFPETFMNLEIWQ